MKKIISLLLLFTLGFSMVGCKPDNSEGSDTSSNANDTTQTLEYTDFKLVDKGVTDYQLVVEENADGNELLAAEEITVFMEQASGVDLKTTTDAEVSYSENSKLIILGDTKFTEHTGVDVSAIPEQGFTLKTVGSNLFILGSDLGALYGAYEFLNQTVNFEMYTADCISLDEGVKELYMPKFDFSDEPDILYRAANYGVVNDAFTRRRMRLCSFNDVFMTQRGDTQHNMFAEFFPKASYETIHPKWYADHGGNPCFTAHGDQTELMIMRETVLTRFKEIVAYNYSLGRELPAINFSMEDDGGACACAACVEVASRYNNTNSAALIQFLNPVAKEFRTWMKRMYPGKEVTITFFAYQVFEDAPVKKENEKYVPIDDSVVLEKNVAVYYAPISASYNYSVDHDKNVELKTVMEKWSVLSKQFYLWPYDTDFREYLGWYNTIDCLQGLYQFLNKFNTVFVFNQGNYTGAPTVTAFKHLQIYINAKLMWNVDANVEELIDNFFAYYFRDAAGAMKEYYNSYQSWTEYMRSTQQLEGWLYHVIDKNQYPKQILVSWNDCIEKAYESLETLKKTDKVAYDLIYDRVCGESIAVRLYLIQLHGSTYPSETLQKMKEDFKADADRLGFTNYSEGSTLEDKIYSEWGL